MSKSNTKEIGDLGEDLACKFLIKNGFGIVDRNYRKKWGEIDIIAKKGPIIHFVEVKSVSRENISDVSKEHNFYRAEDNMHLWKIQRLHRAIQSYLMEKRVSSETEWQLDLITVQIDTKNKHSRVEILLNVII